MKKISIVILVLISFACCTNRITKDQNNTTKNNASKELIDWTNTWIVTSNNHDLPNVLIIGDSHVERYYPVVSEKLKGKGHCSKFTTSKSLGDPVIIAQLKALLFDHTFDIITFNNGLHGVNFTIDEYKSYLPKVYKLLKKNNYNATIIWVNTTARRVKGSLNEYDQYNTGVIDRNKAVEVFAKANNLDLIDMFSFTNTHPEYYENDGIHLNKTGVEEEAKAVFDKVVIAIEKIKR